MRPDPFGLLKEKLGEMAVPDVVAASEDVGRPSLQRLQERLFGAAPESGGLGGKQKTA
jgi:hypothetical protein